MSTQEKQKITVEVNTPKYTDTDKPFLKGDWLDCEKTTDIAPEGRYFIQNNENGSGFFAVAAEAKEYVKTNNIYRVKTLSRYL